MGHSSDPGDGENHFPGDPDTEKQNNKVHHLDRISSLSHYFDNIQKPDLYVEQNPRLEVLWKVNRF